MNYEILNERQLPWIIKKLHRFRVSLTIKDKYALLVVIPLFPGT